MAAFPVLKTGAVAQYPSDRTLHYSTRVCEFIDGGEQRSAEFGQSLRRWTIRLEQLDEGELFRLEQFFADQAGASGSFSFTDPWTGTVYANCSFEGNDIEMTFDGQGNGKGVLMLKENR